MVSADPRPRARAGLKCSDHSKRGRRYVTVLAPEPLRVSLLEPWEHAILVLSNGERSPRDILAILEDSAVAPGLDIAAVGRCLKFFERQELIEDLKLRSAGAEGPANSRTLAEFQVAYLEWHKDLEKTGRILTGALSPPFVEAPVQPAVGLDPTVTEGGPPRPLGGVTGGTAAGSLSPGDTLEDTVRIERPGLEWAPKAAGVESDSES